MIILTAEFVSVLATAYGLNIVGKAVINKACENFLENQCKKQMEKEEA